MLRLKVTKRVQGGHGYQSVILLAFITAVSLLGDSMLYIALPIHWKDVGLLSLVEVGILLSANRFIRLPLNPVISWLYSKMSIRTGLIVALLTAGSTTILYGWANGFVFWLILRCVWGIAWSVLRLGAYYMIVDISTADNRGHHMGSFNGLSRIGGLIGMLGGGFFVEWFGIRNVTLVFGLLAFLSLPLILRIPHIASKERKEANQPLFTFSLFKNKQTLLQLMLSVFLVMLCLEGMVAATLSHLIDVREIAINFNGILLSAAILASLIQAIRLVIGVFLSPWVGKKSDGKWGRRSLLIVALFSASIFLFMSQFSLPVPYWLFNLVAILLTSSILVVLLDSYASDLAEESSRAGTITTYVMISDVGAAFGPVLGYLSEDAFGLKATYWIAASILLLLALQWLLIRTHVSKLIHDN